MGDGLVASFIATLHPMHPRARGQLLRLARAQQRPMPTCRRCGIPFAGVIVAFDRVGGRERTMLFDTRCPHRSQQSRKFEQVMAGLRLTSIPASCASGVLVRSTGPVPCNFGAGSAATGSSTS